MMRTRLQRKLRRAILFLSVGIVTALGLLLTVTIPSAQNPAPPKNGEALSTLQLVNNQAPPTTPTPAAESKKSPLDRTRSDAAELSALAEQLRDELNKLNINVFALDVIEKTEKVERLAKKIKEEANGH